MNRNAKVTQARLTRVSAAAAVVPPLIEFFSILRENGKVLLLTAINQSICLLLSAILSFLLFNFVLFNFFSKKKGETREESVSD
jgi:hypothetical protein